MYNRHDTSHGTIASYVTGFLLSIALTIAAYVAVVTEALPPGPTISVIVGFGVTQLFVQLLFFLHLGKEKKPYSNLTIFCFTLFLVIAVVGGSLWIMHNLKHGTASTEGMADMMSTETQHGGF